MEGIVNDGSHYELLRIHGEQLSSVTFVQDYVQLSFDGPTLTLHRVPVVRHRETTVKWGEPGYRDALCAEIGKRVAKAYVDDGVQLWLQLESGTVFTVSLEGNGQGDDVVFTAPGTDEWATW